LIFNNICGTNQDPCFKSQTPTYADLYSYDDICDFTCYDAGDYKDGTVCAWEWGKSNQYR
jgi:hypothetical protein